MNVMLRWVLNWLVLLDEGVNMLTLGDPGETISSRAGKGARRGVRWCCVLCRFLDRIDRNHCEKAIDAEDGRRAIIKD